MYFLKKYIMDLTDFKLMNWNEEYTPSLFDEYHSHVFSHHYLNNAVDSEEMKTNKEWDFTTEIQVNIFR